MNTWGSIEFIDRVSPLIEIIIFFHDHVLIILILILTLVGYIIISLFFNSFINRFLLEGQDIEVIWTILPAVILILIALPSLHLLYISDEFKRTSYTVKINGHQWYWNYSYLNKRSINIFSFDSFLQKETLRIKRFRLLDVDNRIILPFNTYLRIIVRSSDVLHAWTIPALGIKLDATPGRLNQIRFWLSRPGLYIGQCSEICGAQHRFIPIVLERVRPWIFKKFYKYIKKLRLVYAF